MPQKKIPMRQCIGCQTSRPKKELVRVVRGPDGTISIDTVGKKPGRGAYLCPDPACLAKAQKKKALERSFEQPVPAEVYEALAAQLAINPNTIQKAYGALEQEGYVYSIPGKGSFAADRSEVEDKRREELLAQLSKVVQELRFLGVTDEEISAACGRKEEAS